ncbi:hypothetical protein [Sorangium sp. So ce542]|uniref:hypothetical protein n=1 Tax=Sorangium sp. So ce542 TaxID=3133316 RepID=UPI003F5DADFF
MREAPLTCAKLCASALRGRRRDGPARARRARRRATAGVDGGRFGFSLFDDDPTNAQWELSIDFSPDFGKELEDGDVYSVSVIDADTQRELVSFERTLLYGELQPNGEGPFCTSCDVADIKLPPPATQ